MERLIKEELRRFSTTFFSYTKIVVGGMLVFLVGSILWLGFSLLPQDAQIVIGIVAFIILLSFLITRLIPLPVPKYNPEEKDWILKELGIAGRDVAEIGNLGIFALLLVKPQSTSQLKSIQSDEIFPLYVKLTKVREDEVVPTDIIQKFVFSKQDLRLFLTDVIEILLDEPDPQVRRDYLKKLQLATKNQFQYIRMLIRVTFLIDEILQSATSRECMMSLVREQKIKSSLCQWLIETMPAKLKNITLSLDDFPPEEEKKQNI